MKKSLIVEIYTIGYEPMGESIVFFIIGDGNVLFSGVIDCFENKLTNKTLEILKEKNIEIVDFICLTHPDADHCTGLEKILEKVGPKTYIIYPHNLLQNTEDYDTAVKNGVKKIAEYLSMNKNNPQKTNRIISCSGKIEIIPQKRIMYQNIQTGYKYPLAISTYTPITTVIEKYPAKRLLEKRASLTTHNELSIITAIAIGDFKMLLCGDTENETLESWKECWNENDKNFFKDTIDYLKIPHHTSNGSNLLLESLNNVRIFANSVTTVYRSSNLPNKELIEKYKKRSNKLCCTGHIEKTAVTDNYGVIKLTVDIFENTIKQEVTPNVEVLK